MATTAKAYISAQNNMSNYMDRLSADMQNYVSSAAAAQEHSDQFNAEQAELNRQWQYEMSSTAHQREVQDMKAAGINPILSAYSGGAQTGSGATASSTNQLTGVFGSLAASAMQTASSLAEAIASNSSNQLINKVKTAAEVKKAKISAKAQKYAADQAAAATKYAAQQSRLASQYAADLASKTNISVTKMNNAMQKSITRMNNLTSKEVAKIQKSASISTANINKVAQQYSADLAYLGQLRKIQSDQYIKKMETLTHEISSMLQTTQSNATHIVQSFLGIIDFG